MKYLTRGEHLTYVTLWGVLFAAPLMSFYVRSAADSQAAFSWTEVLMVWRQYAVFLLLFLIHNFLLAPLLVYKQRRWLYFSLVAVVLVGFLLFQCSNRPAHRPHFATEMRGEPEKMDCELNEMGGELSAIDRELAEMDGEQGEPMLPPPPPRHGMHKPGSASNMPPTELKGLPPAIVGQHDVVSTIVLVLMFGMNIAVKLFFKDKEDQRRLAILERENLEQQLEYLKYQINPHFFMNTLNNIHALVDIDPERAKDTIVELSKMMRFVLYEGNKQGVPLAREFDFIQHYVALMRMRYTDHVKISVSLPTDVPDRQVPPLMLITFVENAFKHGISYQQDAFVDVSVDIADDRLHFVCRNSKAPQPASSSGGVGLANVRQRLSLLYGTRHTLKIDDTASSYNVELTIPLS